jgi:hypothetical protein
MVKLLLKFNAAVIREFPFDKDQVTIGRKPDNDIVIDNPAVSGLHARIVKQGGDYLLEDMQSTNGTYLHERKIVKASLRHKDEVGVAKHSIVFLNDEETPAAAPAAPAKSASPDATMVIAAPAPASKEAKAADVVGGLRVVKGQTTAAQFSLVGLTTYIGKSDQAAIRLKGLFAPDLAACVARQPEGYYLKAIKPKSVKHNHQVVTDQIHLQEGDLIEVGNLQLVFYHQSATGPLSG